MQKVYILSDNSELSNYLCNAPKYDDFMDGLKFVQVTSVSNIVERNCCVILDKKGYELEALRLFAKKMYVIICDEKNELEIDVEPDNKILVVGKPYSIDQIYAALKTMMQLMNIEDSANKDKETEIDVKQAAQTDYLTGLPNRRGMYEYFSWGIKTEKIHCMFIDIDNFKKVNDTYGHKMGDKLLIRVSHLVKEKVGEAFFARLSGDEFAVIISGDVPREQVINIAENIMSAVDEVQLNVDVSSIISFSVGIMLDQSAKDDLDDILLKCDVAMYQAKKDGKGKYIIYNDIAKQIEYKMSVDREKYLALNSEQFKLYFRPCMEISTMGIDGIDVDICWEHPRDGLRKPEEFINILEEDSFIVDLENRMFDELCRIITGWNGTVLEGQTVCMRMSKKHLYKKDFLYFLKHIVNKHKLVPEKICLLFNEIDNHPKVNEMLKNLKSEGFLIACGKGISGEKSTLLSVNDTLADEWIINRSLIKDFGVNRTNMIITRSIIALAKDLRIQLVAKGVESETELQYLVRYGCNIAEGNYFADSMKSRELLEFAKDNSITTGNTYLYDFSHGLFDQNGQNEGVFIGQGCKIVHNEELKKDVIKFIGDGTGVFENTMELPAHLLNTKSYTVSLSYKGEEYKLWQSVLYAAYDNGFISIMPYAWDGVGMFRVKDYMYADEWNDAIGREVSVNNWHYITATYNAKKQESRFYVDGELHATAANVHTIEDCVRIVIGGDPWQGVVKGEVGHVVLHDYVAKSDDIRKEYEEYVGKYVKNNIC